MESALRLSLQGQPRGRPGALPAFGEALESVLRAATLLALDEYRETAVTPVRWIEAILRRRDQWSGLLGRLPGLDRLGPAALAAPWAHPGDAEAEGASGIEEENEGRPERPGFAGCTDDLVARATRGGIDPVVGFESEMNAITAILLRRRQRSAVVVGEPGVGKTACALAFARAIVLGDPAIPPNPGDEPALEPHRTSVQPVRRASALHRADARRAGAVRIAKGGLGAGGDQPRADTGRLNGVEQTV